MLIKDPARRPSMRKILEKEFLSRRISKLLTTTIAEKEFSLTFVNKHLAPHQNQSQSSTSAGAGEKEESKGGDIQASVTAIDNDSQSQVTVQNVSKQKIVIKQEAAKKKKRIEVLQGHGTGAG